MMMWQAASPYLSALYLLRFSSGHETTTLRRLSDDSTGPGMPMECLLPHPFIARGRTKFAD